MLAAPGWESIRASKVIHKNWRAKWTGNIQLAPGVDRQEQKSVVRELEQIPTPSDQQH
jgi:hypothetical protein